MLEKDDKMLRVLAWPREKKRRYWMKYDQRLLWRLNNLPDTPISHEQSVANRKLQVMIDRMNKDFQETDPNF